MFLLSTTSSFQVQVLEDKGSQDLFNAQRSFNHSNQSPVSAKKTWNQEKRKRHQVKYENVSRNGTTTFIVFKRKRKQTQTSYP